MSRTGYNRELDFCRPSRYALVPSHGITDTETQYGKLLPVVLFFITVFRMKQGNVSKFDRKLCRILSFEIYPL